MRRFRGSRFRSRRGSVRRRGGRGRGFVKSRSSRFKRRTRPMRIGFRM